MNEKKKLRRLPKRILSFVLTLALVLSLMPGMTLSASAAGGETVWTASECEFCPADGANAKLVLTGVTSSDGNVPPESITIDLGNEFTNIESFEEAYGEDSYTLSMEPIDDEEYGYVEESCFSFRVVNEQHIISEMEVRYNDGTDNCVTLRYSVPEADDCEEHIYRCDLCGGYACELGLASHCYEDGCCTHCYEECPECGNNPYSIGYGNTCSTCGKDGYCNCHFVNGYCEFCGAFCSECYGDSCFIGGGDTCSVCGLEGSYHDYQNGGCIYCGDSCPECDGDSCSIGGGNTCSTCGLEGTDHDYLDGGCIYCGDSCPDCYGDSCSIGGGNTCSTCGLEGIDHDYYDGECIYCYESCPDCYDNSCSIGSENTCSTCGLEGTDHDYQDGACIYCYESCPDCGGGECDLGNGTLCSTCGAGVSNHNLSNGVCTNCGKPCSECYGISCDIGGGNTCSICGLEGTDHDYRDGRCYYCGVSCPDCYDNSCYIGSENTCSTCGLEGTDHDWNDGWCSICWADCPTCGNAEALCMDCPTCGLEKTGDDEHCFLKGVCRLCDYECPHHLVCVVCGTEEGEAGKYTLDEILEKVSEVSDTISNWDGKTPDDYFASYYDEPSFSDFVDLLTDEQTPDFDVNGKVYTISFGETYVFTVTLNSDGDVTKVDFYDIDLEESSSFIDISAIELPGSEIIDLVDAVSDQLICTDEGWEGKSFEYRLDGETFRSKLLRDWSDSCTYEVSDDTHTWDLGGGNVFIVRFENEEVSTLTRTYFDWAYEEDVAEHYVYQEEQHECVDYKQKVNGQAATCENDGWNDYYKCTTCEALYSDAAMTNEITGLEAWKTGDGKIAMKGHDYGSTTYEWSADHTTCTATRTCSHDATHKLTETKQATYVKDADATCTTNEKGHYEVTFDDTQFGSTATTANSKEVENTAKNHNYGTPTYTWSADHTTCTAKMVCSHDSSHVISEVATIDPYDDVMIVQYQGCETNELTKYTAGFTNTAFETQNITVKTNDKYGHNYFTTYTWSADNTTCTAKRQCTHNSSHVETEVSTATSMIVQHKSCTDDEYTTYTATFENTAFNTQTKFAVKTADKLGHTWSYTANGAVLTVTCTNDAAHTATLTLNASNTTYSGTAITVSFADTTGWTALGLTLPTITYEAKSGSALTDGKAVNAGNYTAKATVNDGTTDYTATVDFTITRPSGGSSAPTITVPVTGDENTVKVQASVSGSTATVKDIKDSDLEKVSGGENVEIDLSGLNKTIDTAKIPTTTVEKIAEQGGMSVKLSTATVTFDSKATETISEQAKGNTIELVVDDIKTVSLNAVQKEAVQKLDAALIIDAYLVSNGTRLCSESKGGFGGGKATVALPYEIKGNRTAANYSVYYVDDAGKLEKLNASYDADAKAFVFDIEHLSNYVVAYDENAMLFVDVAEGSFYYDAVLWAAKNGITDGADATHFNPNGGTTRAHVVTFLWRAAGCPEPKAMTSFADVEAGSYYEKAVAWALEQGITKGTSETAFSPDMICTRAHIAAFMARFAGVVDADCQTGFNDVSVNAYYASAVAWMLANGVTEGTTATTYSPDADCTRAQVVTFLYRHMVK